MFIFVALFSLTVFAQNVTEFGSPSELKGVTKIFISLVYQGSVELKDRDRIIKEIEKGKMKNKITNLEIVSRPENAEVILIYSEEIESQISGAVTNKIGNTPVTTVNRRKEWIGKGIVVKPLPDGKQRLIMDSTNSQVNAFQDAPATSFGHDFIKAYIKANASVTDKKK